MAPSLLSTDGYKFSMAEAGWPLRRETFYSSHRKGGLQVLPFDVARELERLWPAVEPGDVEFAAQHGYSLSPTILAGLAERHVEVRALPRFSVFFEREPLFSVTGPSVLASWLEPLVLTWSYRIQVATMEVFEPAALPAAVATVTCEAQRRLVLETLDAVEVRAPAITVDEAGYVARVRRQALELVQIVGDPTRLFEVGLRAASCMEQHLLALEGCKQAGLSRTSNVFGARRLGMVPVGTMGHEHVQRYGSDPAAFRAMVERRYQRSSFLLDTFDTIASGIPAAYEIIRERPGQGDSIRYDSGDKEAQYRHALALAKAQGIRPVQILEDAFDAEQTKVFEALREELGWKPSEQVYGYGGYLVAKTAGTSITRDRVSAVYKLSQTGPKATMKFANEGGAGKQSIPGRPVLFRRRPGARGPWGVVGQEGEGVPEGYELLTGKPEQALAAQVAAARAVAAPDLKLALSHATDTLARELRAEAFGGEG
jgi:nicotinate phosphoribosyltransferase